MDWREVCDSRSLIEVKTWSSKRLACHEGKLLKVMFVDSFNNLYFIKNKRKRSVGKVTRRLRGKFQCVYTGLFVSPSGISELDCATTKTDTAERNISIGRESLQVFFVLGALAYFQVPPLGGSREEKWRSQ